MRPVWTLTHKWCFPGFHGQLVTLRHKLFNLPFPTFLVQAGWLWHLWWMWMHACVKPAFCRFAEVYELRTWYKDLLTAMLTSPLFLSELITTASLRTQKSFVPKLRPVRHNFTKTVELVSPATVCQSLMQANLVNYSSNRLKMLKGRVR